MKSFKTLLLAGLSLMAFTTVYAQEEEEVETDLTTLQFVDADGNVIADGSTLIINPTDVEDAPEVEIKSGLYVKNTTEEPVYASAYVNIKSMDNGRLQCCFPGSCYAKMEVGDFTTEATTPVAAGNTQELQGEWFAEGYGSCTTDFQIKIFEEKLAPGQFVPTKVLKANGPKVTVTFIYSDPASINGVSNDGAKPVAFYNANGQQINNLQKGLNFIKYSNGKTVKTVIK